MKKIICLIALVGILTLSACAAFHSKQPVNPEYYKKTQGIAWPEEKPVATDKPVYVDEGEK